MSPRGLGFWFRALGLGLRLRVGLGWILALGCNVGFKDPSLI